MPDSEKPLKLVRVMSEYNPETSSWDLALYFSNGKRHKYYMIRLPEGAEKEDLVSRLTRAANTIEKFL